MKVKVKIQDIVENLLDRVSALEEAGESDTISGQLKVPSVRVVA